jgi:hypothetical protein
MLQLVGSLLIVVAAVGDKPAGETVAAGLGRVVAAGEARLRGVQSAAVAAGLLLPVAQAIDPQGTQDYLWRAVSFLPSDDDGSTPETWIDTAALALLLAPYDVSTAHRLLEPLVERTRQRVITVVPGSALGLNGDVRR